MTATARHIPLTAKPAFQWRETDCPECNDGWVEEACGISNYERFGGSRSVRCEECGGTGEVTATCECGEEVPLNDDGLCVDCVMPLGDAA